MGKKVKEYKAGDFIFAKVKGYPAWPARVQRMNGKKYFVYFYGTGETANLPPNMIFDYAENKDKFLTKTVKRRDFNDGVKQIEHDFANNVPLEEVLGGAVMETDVGISIDFAQWDEMVNVLVTDLGRRAPPANDSMNNTANDTLNDTTLDTTAANDTIDDETNTTQNDAAVEDSDETGNLVIDEGKKGRKSKAEIKTPAKPKTPRGKAKKEEAKEDDEERKKEEEVVSRSGRKIRPKRYIDEHTEENSTLPSPAPKRRRGASPEKTTEKDKTPPKPTKPTVRNYNSVTQAQLSDLKEPFKPEYNSVNNVFKQTVSQNTLVPTLNSIQISDTKYTVASKKKPKKFVPPLKVDAHDQNKAKTNVSDLEQRNVLSDNTNFKDTYNIEACVNHYDSNTLPCFDYDIHSDVDASKDYTQYEHGLSNLILNSVNLLNGENLILPSQDSDHANVINQSDHYSFCSVASLKVYKDLDAKSFEVKSPDIHVIPTGDAFLNLFRNETKLGVSKPVAMSISTGDVGYNVKYSDYVINHHIDYEENNETETTRQTILKLYPDQNNVQLRKKKKKTK